MPGGNGTGPLGRGPGSGRGLRGGERRPAQNSDNPDWLANLVGTVVLALGSVVIRALTRKRKSSSGKDAIARKEKKPKN